MDESTIHYVKFYRGSKSAYTRLKEAQKLNNDVLYFVYELDNQDKGQLYLGDRLISGIDETSSVVISLDDLADVHIGDIPLANYQILIYDEESEAWVNSDLSEIIGEMQGATAEEPGKSGLVPVPKAGDQNKLLRGNGSWANVNEIIKLDTKVFSTNKSGETTIKGFEDANPGQVLTVDENGQIIWSSNISSKLKRKIVNSTDEISLEDPEADSTIYMVKHEGSDEEQNVYDEFLIIDVDGEKSIELIGSSAVDLSNYVTKEYVDSKIKILNDTVFGTDGNGLEARLSKVESTIINYSAIGDLSTLISQETTVVEEIQKINDRLTWQSIDEIK